MVDMTGLTTPRRTRLVWHTAEIKRTAASLLAYAIIGVVTATGLWVGLAALAAIGKSYGLS